MINNKRIRISSIFSSFVLILLLSCSSETMEMGTKNSTKINGVSLVSSKIELTPNHIDPIKNINSNYIAVIPFGFIRELSNPIISYNTNNQWFGETREGIIQYVEELKEKDLKIMLKPQIWVWQGEFTGNIKMDNEEDWSTLEDSYSAFLLDFASLAEELGIELLCIGTELEQFVVNRPEYWLSLIEKIKKIYKGHLTYASNWNEFERVPFWTSVDYIGIDAYFPISNNKTPSVQDCKNGWVQHKNDIENVNIQFGKPILFTEFGYRSIDFTANEPWNSDRIDGKVNLLAQSNALEALLDEFWGEDWFGGGFVWKWHMEHEMSGGGSNNRFTPQNKLAEELLKKRYGLYP